MDFVENFWKILFHFCRLFCVEHVNFFPTCFFLPESGIDRIISQTFRGEWDNKSRIGFSFVIAIARENRPSRHWVASKATDISKSFYAIRRRRRYFFNSSNSPHFSLEIYLKLEKESGSTRWRQYFGGPSIHNLNLFNAFHRSTPSPPPQTGSEVYSELRFFLSFSSPSTIRLN